MSNITKDIRPESKSDYRGFENDAIKRGENPFYRPTIEEFLKDDFVIFDARKKEEYLSRKSSDSKQDLKDLLSDIGK